MAYWIPFVYRELVLHLWVVGLGPLLLQLLVVLVLPDFVATLLAVLSIFFFVPIVVTMPVMIAPFPLLGSHVPIFSTCIRHNIVNHCAKMSFMGFPF